MFTYIREIRVGRNCILHLKILSSLRSQRKCKQDRHWPGFHESLPKRSSIPESPSLKNLIQVMPLFFSCRGWAKEMRLDLASLSQKNNNDIKKSLPVRYFTLARALSSASKYHTVIAYLRKCKKKELLNYEAKYQWSTWHETQPKLDDTSAGWQRNVFIKHAVVLGFFSY